ncbi:hypothetical protein M0R45_018072 [Rubus argutus]|uniref:Uncharacterized protein n=1 Tax=Rubus argutus TaxID=59490 RepID=A0AAW1Y0W6_RUBAR
MEKRKGFKEANNGETGGGAEMGERRRDLGVKVKKFGKWGSGWNQEQREKEVVMMNLQEMMNKIEVERHDVRMSIKQLNEELDNLKTAACSTEKLDSSVDAYHLVNEVPQPNLETNRNKTANISAALLSQVPRFMRPTVCSRRKSGPDHLTTEEKLRFPARRRRPFNHYAKSVNFPVKGISENNSECSISRNSCLVPLNVNNSADAETDYSQDLSECDIKELIHGEGSENGDKDNACSAKYLKVDKWLCHKNAPAIRSHVHRNKRVLAIPTPEKKLICKGQKETETFQDEKVNNYKLAVKQIIGHNKSEKHADVEGSQRFMQEVIINKPPTSMNVNDNIDTKCNSDSSSDGIVRETMINAQQKLDDVPTEKHTLSSIYPPDILCSNFNSNQDDNKVNSLSTMQAVIGETECSDISLSNNSNWRQISTIGLVYSILDSRQDSNISISRIEQKSGFRHLPIAIGGDDSEKEDLEKLSQSSGEGTRPGLQKMRSQDNNVNLGICHLLQQKIHILWASAFLGLGFQNLGLEQEFFFGLML